MRIDYSNTLRTLRKIRKKGEELKDIELITNVSIVIGHIEAYDSMLSCQSSVDSNQQETTKAGGKNGETL